jgi:hypothetical protein
MLEGETVASGAGHPGTELLVLQSAAGFYIGYLTKDGFPYSRESGYYETEELAETALVSGRFGR